uniref:Uncharacterized protein n=1 Tax=Fagus sylvatica TaxID=28930 RepID=A0A2N9IC11_FAGSY
MFGTRFCSLSLSTVCSLHHPEPPPAGHPQPPPAGHPQPRLFSAHFLSRPNRASQPEPARHRSQRLRPPSHRRSVSPTDCFSDGKPPTLRPLPLTDWIGSDLI